ncbi:hypothetical protein BDN72DRAFT_892173 [Pluteus cervinus]|uniref:Uncharacterized protein n=1 Tax=Pluteus cervinus TaxID=181527 RepID=A0ACD3BDE5_9AGAR|nr:hypothetical protein BDN72DRAFT_892173 [Pluteus cervinus]
MSLSKSLLHTICKKMVLTAQLHALVNSILLAITFFKLPHEIQHSLTRTARAHRESNQETWTCIVGFGEGFLFGALTQELRLRFPDATRELLTVLRHILLSPEFLVGLVGTVDLPGIQPEAVYVLSHQAYERGGFDKVRQLAKLIYAPLFPVARRVVEPRWTELPGPSPLGPASSPMNNHNAGPTPVHEDIPPALVGLRDWVLSNTVADPESGYLRQKTVDSRSSSNMGDVGF